MTPTQALTHVMDDWMADTPEDDQAAEVLEMAVRLAESMLELDQRQLTALALLPTSTLLARAVLRRQVAQ